MTAAAPPPASAAPREPLKPGPDDVPTVGAPDATVGKPSALIPAAENKPSQGSNEKDKGITKAVVAPLEPLSGKLTQDDIRRILDSQGDVFGDCYTLGAGGKLKDFKGVVTVKATIGPSGTVNQSEITKSTTKNLKVDACVRETFKKIKFPRPRDGGTSVITFPITFSGVEQVQ